MAYQRVTLATLRTQLSSRLKTSGVFWSQAEQDRALNEAIAAWQLMTGDHVINVTQAITDTTKNVVDLVTTDSQGGLLSVLRMKPASGAAPRELSVFELDHGFYGWRTETASLTTQRPDYWAPIGVSSVAIYPRVGATATYTFQAYGDVVALTATNSYIDIGEGELQRVLGLAQAILQFKEGLPEGTDNTKALRELFTFIAQNRNKALLETAAYKNYMGGQNEEGAPKEAAPQSGIRG